jgi:hypothetical protein
VIAARSQLVTACAALAVAVASGLAACSPGTPRPPTRSAGAASPTRETVSLGITLVCDTALYCGQIGAGMCALSDISTPYPDTRLTVAGPDGTVLATRPLPLDGSVSDATPGRYACAVSLTLTVPRQSLYRVDAFGLRSASGAGPFTIAVP